MKEIYKILVGTFAANLSVGFIVLKLTNVVNWTWPVVLSPIILFGVLLGIIHAIKNSR